MVKYEAVITWYNDVLNVEAEDREEATNKVFDMMTPEEKEQYSEILLKKVEQ